MRIIKTQSELATLIDEYETAPFVTVDTEFMRERTYWPVLCLVQIARPGDDPGSAAIIDPIEGDLDLEPLCALMVKPDVVKVFHAARQDIEIFHHMSGRVPAPLFDTQVAAMVCGFGDQVGYETLVRKIPKASLDKSSRFTDWSRRPLTERQLTYALADVTHLRDIYLELDRRIRETDRSGWVAEEMAVLSDPGTYLIDPESAWRRLKTRSNNRKFLSIARELAAWREREAQRRDIPRARLLKDDALFEICANQPQSMDELSRSRLLFREGRRADVAEGILAAVKRGLETPAAKAPPAPDAKTQKPNGAESALTELLRVLLKAKADELGVAHRLLASAADLEAIACEESPDVPALSGWRREAFGGDALRLKRGEIALGAGRDGVQVIDIGPPTEAEAEA